MGCGIDPRNAHIATINPSNRSTLSLALPGADCAIWEGNMPSNGLAQVARTRRLRGCAFPGIIRNGGYFLTDLEVFEDGIINCWEMVDLPLFQQKLEARWIVTSIPAGKELSHHELGFFDVLEPQWTHSPETLLAYVDRLVSELNPSRDNLFDCRGSSTISVNGMNVFKLSVSSTPWKEPPRPFLQGLEGKSLKHFKKIDEQFQLVSIAIFKDDTVAIDGLPESSRMTFQDFEGELANPDLFNIPKFGDRIKIEHLGEFTVGPKSELTALADINGAVRLERNRLMGMPDAAALCAQAFKDYCANPAPETRDRLRQHYEAIPSHLRSAVLGDMDVKDIPIRMAIYGEAEIEGWSHYQVAKHLGMNLPTIDVPKIKGVQD
jgi:hypothetical protein